MRELAERSTLYLSSYRLNQLGVTDGQAVQVRFGCATTKAVVRLGEGVDHLRLSPMLRARLHYPASYSGKVVYHRERNEVHLGPLIGLLTVPFGSHDSVGRTALYRGLRRAGKKIGALVYAFTTQDVDWGRRVVRASVEGGQGHKFVTLPLPDVIYNRIPNRGLERTVHHRTFLRNLSNVSGTYMFNPRFFNKWQVHRWLSAMGEVDHLLPETRPLRSVRDVEVILQKHRHAYVKPVGGSLGKGIVRVYRSKGGGYVVAYRSGHSNIEHRHSSWAQAAADILAARHRRGYLVQQGLTLAKHRGRNFDVRVTMHKNGHGEWAAVGPAAKVAISGAITTHVHNGGRTYPLMQVLREVFPGEEHVIYERIVQAGKEVAVAMEKAMKAQIGELGLDLGITPEGRVYLFEANAKPGRMVFAPSWARKDRWDSFHCVCAYAHYAAGFGAIK